MAGKWTDAENAVLEDVAKMGATLQSQMHRLPGRTHNGAKLQASRLKIRLSGSAAWSFEERQILRRIWRSEESLKVGLKQLPNRTLFAAKGEAHRLGLGGQRPKGKKGHSWVENACARLLDGGGRMTVAQLVTMTGSSSCAVYRSLNRRRGARFRVGAWTRTAVHGNFAGWWELGAGPDAPRPSTKPPSQSAKEWRARRRMRAAFNPFATVLMQVAA